MILKYLGVRPDSIGIDQHWYMIGENEVPVDAIEELESVDDDEVTPLKHTKHIFLSKIISQVRDMITLNMEEDQEQDNCFQ